VENVQIENNITKSKHETALY